MKRRDAFKKIGLMSLIGLSGMAIFSCSDDQNKTKEAISDITKDVTPKIKTAREKLIVNRTQMSFADPENPTKAELKHTPEITFGNKDEKGNVLVKITIGQQGIIHPATDNHWIDFLTVYVNGIEKVSIDFANGGVRAFGHFYLAIAHGDSIKAISGCNIHGIWENATKY